MNFFDNLKKISRVHGYLILIIVLFTVGTFLRLYNFQNRLIFGPEQAISLITASSYLDKFSLLGEVNLQRTTSTGLNPFHGAYFNYFLVPFIILFKFNPLPITYFFLFLNLFTAYLFFRVSNKLFGKLIAVFALIYFLFSSKMIHHSLFIWNLNFLPLLGILVLWIFANLYKNRQKIIYPFWLGVIGGIGFGLQYLFLPFIIFIFALSVLLSKKKIQSIIAFVVGIIIGGLSMVIFDLRHDFYYTRTLWQYFIDSINNKVNGGIHYYDFMYLLPYLFLIYAAVTTVLYKIWKPLCLIPLVIFVFINLNSPQINYQNSTGVAPGITLKVLESASAIIAADNPPQKYNVVTLWDFDTRAHTLRYFLTNYYKRSPQGVEEYKNIDVLYAFAPEDYNIDIPNVYELNQFFPYKITELSSNTAGYRLYKLTK